jgi:sulfide:quinone oxidoreductase
MRLRIVDLGAGFGGLELSTILSEVIGESLDRTLIDKSDSFYIGFSNFEVMFGYKAFNAITLAYRNIVKTGAKFRQEMITSIDTSSQFLHLGEVTFKLLKAW